jgi:peroxiredoxin
MHENKLKSIFIMSLLAGNVVIMIHSGLRLFSSFSPAWVLSLAASVSVCSVFLLYIGTGKRPRTSENLPVLLAITGLCSACFLFIDLTSSDILPLFYTTVMSTAGAWLYVYWYSRLDRSGTRISINEHLPDFTLYNDQGEAISVNQINGALILIFYRGNWCPLCTAQVEEMATHYAELEKRGYSVLMVSPQSQEETRKIANRFSVPMIFCEDRDHQAAHTLGIFHETGLPIGMDKMGYSKDTVLPTVLITNKDHNVIWLHATDNYRVRPEPTTFIKVIDDYAA